MAPAMMMTAEPMAPTEAEIVPGMTATALFPVTVMMTVAMTAMP